MMICLTLLAPQDHDLFIDREDLARHNDHGEFNDIEAYESDCPYTHTAF